MPASVVIGTQWGDEGKGKATDYLADRMDFVVRYQGGNNAGHTILAEGHTLKLQLIPSGILYPHITSVIADGVVVDPRALLEEMDGLSAVGIDPSRLAVSGNCHMIMPYHLELEKVTERFLGKNALGTTKRGIGPAYADKAARIGIRIQDLFDEKIFRESLGLLGQEFGTVTGRKRRCGWFDAVILRYASRVNGLTELFVTKLDVLSGFPTLKVCTAYRAEGETFEDVPPHQSLFHAAEPVYEELDGWDEDLTAARSIQDLPSAARAYLDRLAELGGVPISVVSVGPGREQSLPASA